MPQIFSNIIKFYYKSGINPPIFKGSKDYTRN